MPEPRGSHESPRWPGFVESPMKVRDLLSPEAIARLEVEFEARRLARARFMVRRARRRRMKNIEGESG